MTLLAELLRIKEYREDKAELGVIKSRSILAETMRRNDEARDALDRYERWSDERERQLYSGILGRSIKLRELTYLREDVALLKQKKLALSESLNRADAEQTEAQVAADVARDTHEVAARAREKFVQLVQAHSEELRLENERKEDGEIEELTSVRHTGDEGENHEDT